MTGCMADMDVVLSLLYSTLAVNVVTLLPSSTWTSTMLLFRDVTDDEYTIPETSNYANLHADVEL